MNNEIMTSLLSVVSDETLDMIMHDIFTLLGKPAIGASMGLATLEWQGRYPGTIAPCIFKRAQQKGGFPECYDGPRDTIDLRTGVRISLQRIH